MSNCKCQAYYIHISCSLYSYHAQYIYTYYVHCASVSCPICISCDLYTYQVLYTDVDRTGIQTLESSASTRTVKAGTWSLGLSPVRSAWTGRWPDREASRLTRTHGTSWTLMFRTCACLSSWWTTTRLQGTEVPLWLVLWDIRQTKLTLQLQLQQGQGFSFF